MNINTQYPGGNLKVLSVDNDVVHIAPDLRDTSIDWFYWSFCVEGAQGKTIRFDFDGHCRLGYWGPAVSYDNENWHWLGKSGNRDGTFFDYTFAPNEDKVYFCHHMSYQVKRFLDFAKRERLNMSLLCISEKGSEIPLVRIGSDGPVVLLTSRHHCCESTGTYLMEGILREFAHDPPKGFQIVAIPFVDYDGVLAGDPGKERLPHDHNRDYIDQPIYSSIRAIKDLSKREKIIVALDLHSPGHRTHEHDHCYILRSPLNCNPQREIFSRLLEAETRADTRAFPFWHNFMFKSAKSIPGTFGYYFGSCTDVQLSMTIETTYAGHYGCAVSQENLLELGACISRVLRVMYSTVCT